MPLAIRLSSTFTFALENVYLSDNLSAEVIILQYTSRRKGFIYFYYIDLARAKSEPLVNNTYKRKKLNRIMLNRDDNENGFKTNRSISKKTNCPCSTLFLLISKKQICTCSALFCFSLAVVLHDYIAVLYD